ncbi:MAG TPA: hypothetical protein VN364_14010 [Bellilinea sp.]|nr:hypothetical protein [Bellilinea sp.]
MLEPFDDKGKIYTQVITKSPIKVILQTAFHRIHGYIHVRIGERLKDELDTAVNFLAVTDAVVFDLTGNTQLFKTNFMAVNRNQIVWVIPEDDLESAMREN